MMQELLSHAHTPDHSHLEGLSRFRHVELWQTLKNVIHSLLTELCGMCLRSSDIIHTLLHPCQLTSCKQQHHFKNMMHTSRNQLYNNDQHVQTSREITEMLYSTDLIYSVMTCVLGINALMRWHGLTFRAGLFSRLIALAVCRAVWLFICILLSVLQTQLMAHLNAWPTVRTIRMAWLWERRKITFRILNT